MLQLHNSDEYFFFRFVLRVFMPPLCYFCFTLSIHQGVRNLLFV
jgi:hypothetical protein